MTAARSVVRPLVRPLVQQLTGGVVDQVISAVIKPTMSPLYHGDALQDVANWETFGEDTNYVPLPGRTIVSVVRGYLGDAVDASTALSAGDTVGFTITATDSEGNVVVFTAFPIAVQDVAPAVDAAPSASGDVYEGGNLTGTSGTFTGTNLVEIDEWEVSDDGSTDWAGTGDADTSSPALVLGKYYRFASMAANSSGSVTTYSDVLGPIVEAPSAATVDSVTAGTWTGSAQPLTVAATGAENGDGVYWVIVPAADSAPSASEVRAGQANGGGSPTESGNDVWPGPFSDTLVSNIARGSYKIYVVIDNGALSNVGASVAFTVDTTASALGTPLAAENSGDIDWSVTSNEANGEIYAALRLSANPVLSAENIINGTGDAIDTDSDDTPAADDTNGGSFLAPAVGTYRVDMVQVDDFGNVSSVVTSAEVEITASSDAMGDDTGVIYHFGYDDTTRSGTDVTAVNDKGGNAFALDSTPVAFSAPQQADASSPVVFDETGPTIIQTATKAAGNRLLQQHFIGGGSARVFIVLDGASVDSFFGAVLNESNDNQSNLSILFGAGKFGSNLRFYALARQFANAVTINYDSGIPLAGLGTVIVEYLITQTDWTTYLNGTENSTGTVTAANFPTHATARTSLGGRASDTASNDNATCDWSEIFITSTVDGTHAADVRAQLAAKYSITL